MPTIFTVFGCRVAIYKNDHRPSHVHVIGQGHEAVFNLQCPNGLPVLRENYGFSHSEVSKISKELAKQIEMLCQSWRLIHGNY